MQLCCWCVVQIEIQCVLAHTGLNDVNNQQMMALLSLIVQTSWDGDHSCTDDAVSATCMSCEFCLLLYQLTASVLQFIVPISESLVPTQDVPDIDVLATTATKYTTGKNNQLVFLTNSLTSLMMTL